MTETVEYRNLNWRAVKASNRLQACQTLQSPHHPGIVGHAWVQYTKDMFLLDRVQKIQELLAEPRQTLVGRRMHGEAAADFALMKAHIDGLGVLQARIDVLEAGDCIVDVEQIAVAAAAVEKSLDSNNFQANRHMDLLVHQRCRRVMAQYRLQDCTVVGMCFGCRHTPPDCSCFAVVEVVEVECNSADCMPAAAEIHRSLDRHSLCCSATDTRPGRRSRCGTAVQIPSQQVGTGCCTSFGPGIHNDSAAGAEPELTLAAVHTAVPCNHHSVPAVGSDCTDRSSLREAVAAPEAVYNDRLDSTTWCKKS